jgi:hypothetical protein
MQQFKVISLSLGGLRNKVYQSGDVITQANVADDVDNLVRNGFLVPLESEKKWVTPKTEAAKAVEVVEDEVIEPIGLAAALGTPIKTEWPPIDEMTVFDIKEALGEKAPKKQTKKSDLYDMLVNG